MGNMVHFRGKLELVAKKEGEKLEEQIARILGLKELHEDYTTYAEYVCYECSGEYYVYDGHLYRVQGKTSHMEEAIYVAYPDKEDNINLVLNYYSGGCNLEEAIEEALEDMEKEDRV